LEEFSAPAFLFYSQEQ